MRPWIRHLACVGILSAAAISASGQNRPQELIVDVTDATKGQTVTAPRPKVNHQAIDKLGWKLGTQCYTFRHMTLMDTIDRAAELNLQYVELYPGQRFSQENPVSANHDTMTQEMMDQVKQKLREKNLVAMNYGVVSVGGSEEASRKVFEFCRKMGISTVVSEPPRSRNPDRQQALAEDRKMFEMLDKLCNEYGINLALHNHPEPNPYGTPDKVLEVVEGRSKRIGACADLGHWQRSGIRPIDAVRKLEGRIICSHVKDLNEFGNRNAYDVPWGTGVGEIEQTLAELAKQGAKVAFSVEYERMYPGMVPDIARSAEWFSNVATKLAEQR